MKEAEISSHQRNYFSMLFVLIFVSSLALGLTVEPNVGRECKSGEKGEAGIKYYIDEDRSTVYPFYYKGCGGGEYNRYDSEDEAYRLLPVDGGSCPGWPKVTESCSDGSFDPPTKCKDGYECRRLGISTAGSCCNKDYAERAEKDRTAKCPGGMKVVMVKHPGYETRYVGRKCAHNFCPKGATCINGNFEAFCCK